MLGVVKGKFNPKARVKRHGNLLPDVTKPNDPHSGTQNKPSRHKYTAVAQFWSRPKGRFAAIAPECLAQNTRHGFWKATAQGMAREKLSEAQAKEIMDRWTALERKQRKS